MKLIIGLTALLAGLVMGQSVSTKTTVGKNVQLSLAAGDRLVCGKNPSAFSGGTSLIDYTVPSSHSLKGMLILSSVQN